ncbi:BTB/POZ domain-containing protein [Ditylenchus destructor]|uniref:BTB/POZ domain-containing protein n=1 Tax=Ditylenchus destructor TaxID=166010 RepID=A0AAD4MQ32_9BILA|nr:BTB/POZ domain-containing protein [Ditylenchus destructor]
MSALPYSETVTIPNFQTFLLKENDERGVCAESSSVKCGRHTSHLVICRPSGKEYLSAYLDYAPDVNFPTAIEMVTAEVRLKSYKKDFDQTTMISCGRRRLASIKAIHLHGQIWINHARGRISFVSPKASEVCIFVLNFHLILIKFSRLYLTIPEDIGNKEIFTSIELGDMNWNLTALRDGDNYRVYLGCAPIQTTSAEWTCAVTARMQFKMQDSIGVFDDVLQDVSHIMRDGDDRRQCYDFSWVDVFGSQEGSFYVREDHSVELYAYINAEPVQLVIDKFAIKLFNTFNEKIALNRTVAINDEKIKVNQELLAAYSPYFSTLFFTEKFAEKGKDEVRLQDMKPAEFKEFISLLYPHYKPITEENKEYILKLADRFQVEWLTQRCEQYYLRRFKPALFPPLRILLETLKETIRLADKYRLRKLMNATFEKPLDADALIELLLDRNFWDELSEDTQIRIRKEMGGTVTNSRKRKLSGNSQ